MLNPFSNTLNCSSFSVFSKYVGFIFENFNKNSFENLGNEGVLAIVGDSTNADVPGFSKSENDVKLELSNIAFANVNTMKGLSSHGALTRINVPTEDGMRNVVAPAAKFNGKHREMRKVPSLGEHNEMIREEFGGGRGKE